MPNYRVIEIENIAERHPVRAFDAYWKKHAAQGEIPRRNQINPAEIAGILPWLLVLEANRFGTCIDYRYRLAGTGCTEIFGVDYTGKSLGENLTPEGTEIRRREFEQILLEGRPIISTTNLPIKGKDFIRVHRGAYPVRASAGMADQIFVAIAPVATECTTRIPAGI